jgi:hypothetical protein
MIIKACIECQHFKAADNLYTPHAPRRESQPECLHPQAASRDLVYGKALCYNERAANKGCGKQGKLWEPLKT